MVVDWRDFVPVLVAVAVFTVVDFLTHRWLEGLGVLVGGDVVGGGYYLNKVLFGSVIVLGLLWFWVRDGRSVFGLPKIWFLSVVGVLLLQVRYVYVGYSLLFHLIFVPAHIVALRFGLGVARVRV